MDSNGNLNYAERRALRPGDRVVYQTETLAHRGEMTGMVSRVGESGIVYIGKHGARYALLSDFVRRADWPGEAEQPAEAAPEPARRAARRKAGKDTAKAPDAPDGQEMASVEVVDPETGLLMAPAIKGVIDDLRAQVAALTVERDIARNHWRTVKQTIREISERLMEVTHE